MNENANEMFDAKLCAVWESSKNNKSWHILQNILSSVLQKK